jgi:RecQ family ATP-dependent DNA helicase
MGACSYHETAERSSPDEDDRLGSLLATAFRFSAFRPNQEAVCRAAIQGSDVLLVMPTGSGKSLCYQLPGVARGGTTLVVSPLIALMDDQVAKLRELGFSVAAIHSGRERSASRQACIDYLSGKLQFLFIAPERLRVPRFPEMLAKRKLSLIAIDEAHCISQWGHDFRPDYRMLGQYLPNLRPAPVIALTATATPIVQDDIRRQLGLIQPKSFVHGFRRTNIAVEVVEVPTSRRAALARELLLVEERRPAIVYTPTRKQAELLAADLSGAFAAAPYHAGLDAEHRKRVQEAFLAGKIEVMTATIAFGMGIDKPDIRMVIHTALPGSVEQYYQEMGRVGRDGKPSRAILMHSYADRQTHDFFLARDYPQVEVLDSIFHRLGSQAQRKSELQRQVRIDPDLFEKALEKLWIHGGAVLEFGELVRRGQRPWREPYVAQAERKRSQVEQMIRYAESNRCRMSSVVRHFGDLGDAEQVCGICDFCSPARCLAQRFRSATETERETLFRVVAMLRSSSVTSTGKLHRELYPAGGMARHDFEEVLGGMARAGLLRLAEATFEKDGKAIPYCRVTLTQAGYAVDQSMPVAFVMKNTSTASTLRRPQGKTTAPKNRKRRRASVPEMPATANSRGRATPSEGEPGAPFRAEAMLRAWRLAESRRRGVPAFRIFTDKALQAMAAARPSGTQGLLTISGLGIRTVEQYGVEICRILSGRSD